MYNKHLWQKTYFIKGYVAIFKIVHLSLQKISRGANVGGCCYPHPLIPKLKKQDLVKILANQTTLCCLDVIKLL